MGVVTEGDGERHEQARLGVGPEEGEVVGGSHLHGDGAVRKDDRAAERNQRQFARERGQRGGEHVCLR